MIIKWWCGTDALKLVMYPPGKKIWYIRIFLERILWRIIHRFFNHWAKSKQIQKALIKFGVNPKKIKLMKNFKKDYHLNLKKKKHRRFNILFYWSKSKRRNHKYKKWYYGYDLFVEFREKVRMLNYPYINFMVVKGNHNMKGIYPVIDLYIRFNRWDGDPRMIIECESLKIEYYYNTDFKPNIEEALIKFKEIYEKKYNKIPAL